MSSELPNQLQTRKLQLAEGILDSVAHNAQMVVKSSEGESAALQLLANQLKETQEEVALKTQMVLQTKSAISEEIPLSVIPEQPTSEEQVQFSAINDGLREALAQTEKEAMLYKVELEQIKNTTVPLAEHRAVEAHLATISRDSKQLASKNRDLEQEITRLQQTVTEVQSFQSSAVPVTIQPIEGQLAVNSKLEEEFERIQETALNDSAAKDALGKYALKSEECSRLQKQLEEAKRMEKLAREDAQQLTWENGELKQQVVHLLHKHNESPRFELERIIAQPVTEKDLKVFGSFTLPKIKELTGVALHVPVQDQGAVNFSEFSVDNIRQLVDRCSELSKELWKCSQEGSSLVPAAGHKRNRDLHVEPSGSSAISRPLPPTQRAQTLKRDCGMQCEAFEVLDAILDIDRGDFGQTEGLEMSFAGRRSQYVGRPSSYVSSEVVGAEKLVSAVVAASLRKEEFETATASCWRDEESHTKSALAECLSYIEELEEKLLSTRVELENAELTSSELSARLSAEINKNADVVSIRACFEQRLAQPLDLLSQSNFGIQDILKTASEEKGVASNSLMEASSTFHELAESLTTQEEAMKNLLIVSAQQRPENSQKNETLKEEIARVRRELSQEQSRSEEYFNRVRSAEERESKMAEQQWSIEVQLEEKDTELSAMQKRLSAMLSPERATELENSIAELEKHRQQLKEESEATCSELRSKWHSFEAQLEKEKQSHVATKQALEITNGELQSTQANLRSAINDAASAQQEQQHLSSQLETSMNQEARARDTIKSLENHIEEARRETLRLQGLRLSELSSQQIKELFPADQSVIASTELIHSLQSRDNQLTREHALAKQQIVQLQEKRDSLHEDLRSLQGEFNLSEANNLKALCEARSAREVAEAHAGQSASEAAAANRRYQLLQDEVNLLTQQKVELEAKLQVLASGPISSVVRKYGVKTTLDLQEQMEELFTSKTQVEDLLSETNAKLEEITSEVSRRAENEQRLLDQVSSLQLQHQQMIEERDSLVAQLSEMKGEKIQLESLLDEFKADLTKTREEVAEYESKCDSVSIEFSEMKEQAARLHRDLEEERREKSTFENKFDGAREELHSTLDAKRKADEQHSLVLKDFETMTDDNMLLKQQVSHLTEALKELKAAGPGRSSAGGRLTKQRGSVFSSLRNQ